MFTTLTALVVAAVFFSAVLRGMAGFGFALAAVPILSLVLPPLQAVTLAVLMQVIVGIHDIFSMHSNVHKPTLMRLCLGSLLGTPIGIFALAALSPDAARILIAAAVLGGLALLLRYKPTEPRPRHGLALFAGVASGAFSGLAAMPGPPAVAFYLGAGISAVQTRASLFLFFFVTALIATPGLVIAGGASTQILALGWTLNYMIWWLAWSPFVGIFIARISRGRTIREFLVGVIVAPTLFSILWFGVFGGIGFFDALRQEGALTAVNDQNLDATTFALLESFPLNGLTRAATVLAAFLFVVTSVVSAGFTLAMIGTGGNENPTPGVRTIWGAILGALGFAMVLVGDISLVRSIIALSAIAFVFIVPILVLCLLRSLKREETK